MRVRTVLGGAALAGVGVTVGACVASPEPPRVVLDEQEARSLIMRERIGDAPEASTSGSACRAYCATSYATACWRVTQLCAGAEVVTVGASTIPCGTAIAAVCLSSAALASLCSDSCPP
jgi:hypothetical protein